MNLDNLPIQDMTVGDLVKIDKQIKEAKRMEPNYEKAFEIICAEFENVRLHNTVFQEKLLREGIIDHDLKVIVEGALIQGKRMMPKVEVPKVEVY